ncbi:hypothetical protein J7T55_013034 [Diaporthe amygdali]|uniref:uncharacterized protein n=1 Tax=Phomopsis amygdali TaxID=1214568 RepID=UPI0022FE796F|nr:uncharacterized protein J7T55_013034 [Diaporthe amygdali]KAJ0118780.1 hypothetical protein J7T55_013034 [Diaporthe amygdali]
MKVTVFLILAALTATESVTAAPLSAGETNSTSPRFYNGSCTPETITIRREWRTLSAEEKAAYIQAQQCLIKLPAQSGLQAVTSRFSDLQGSHRSYTDTIYGDIIHYVGQFLPWHRMMMHAFETLMRNECNYTGTMPWWDEQADADSGNFFRSNMWDADTGFGGNGTEPDGCLTEGPFANTTEYIGPMLEYTTYCQKRIWDNEYGITTGNSTLINLCNSYETYEDFWYCIAYWPHHGAHTATGGLMADKDASPGDPVFYLHHNYIDRLWWKWQAADNETRLWDMSGNTVNETLYPQQAGVKASLNTTIQQQNIIPDIQIREVMNAQGGYLCYDYDY